jgi:hypothetical protein
MAYVPVNLDMFIAAYAGTMYGITANNAAITDPTVADYANAAIISGAFAQACDIAWNNAATPDQLDVQMLQSSCANYWLGRTATPVTIASFDLNTSWTVPANAIVALIKAGEAYMAAQGIVPPAWNSGGSSTITVTGDLSGTAQPLTAADLTVNESSTAPGGLFLVKNAGAAGNNVGAVGTVPTSAAGGLFLFPSGAALSPSATNYALDNDGTMLHVSNYTAGPVQIETDTTPVAAFTSSGIGLAQPLFGISDGNPLTFGNVTVAVAATGTTALTLPQQKTPGLTVNAVVIGGAGATINFGNIGGAEAAFFLLDLGNVTTSGNALTLQNGTDTVNIAPFMSSTVPESNLFLIKCSTNVIRFACGFG